MKNKTIPTFTIKALQSFFTTWALMKACRMESGNILTLVFFLLCIFFYQRIDARFREVCLCNQKTSSRTALCVALIFTALYMAVDYPNYISGLTNPLFCAGILSAVIIGFSTLFYKLLLLLFSYTGNQPMLEKFLFRTCTITENGIPATPFFSRLFHTVSGFYQNHVGLCTFFLCVFCWLPYYLYQYPGVMTPDSINQFEQVLGLIPYSNHHPWVHTLLFGLLYNIGFKLTGSMLVSVSLYTFCQMCFLAFAASYFIGTLPQYKIRSSISLVLTLFYALVPYHAVFSVTIWKDIPFAGAVLLFTTAMLRFHQKITPGNLCIFTVSGFMMCLFRSNGWYGFLLCVPFLLFYFRKKARVLYPALGIILLSAVIVKYPVMNHFHVTQPDTIESFSIPAQQIAAVICNDRALTKDQLALIERVVDLTYIHELYAPTFADNIKELVRAGDQDYLAAHKKEFFKLWLELGLTYPGDYLKAYIDQTHGYWYPDSFYLVAEAEGISASHLGVSHTPLIRGPVVMKLKEISIKLGSILPLYGTLWSMGVVCWVLIFCMGNSLIRREYAKFILYLPGIALLGTVLIATPVATEFRYVYFLIFSLPFYVLVTLLPSDRTIQKK